MKEMVKKYAIDENLNCAETMLHVAAEAWGLEVPAAAYHAVGPYGGGCGCGETCGALLGSLAAIGVRDITTDAHQTEGLRDTAGQFVKDFAEHFGSIQCTPLKEKYAQPEIRCLHLLEQTAELLDGYSK